MRILITGAGGFLGRYLVDSLLRQGERDLRLHYRRQPEPAALNDIRERYPEARLDVMAANLQQPAQVTPLTAGVDLIIHAAAAKRGAAADMFLNTVIGTRNLIEAALAQGCKRLALISSFAVYRSAELATGAVIDETCPSEPDGLDKGIYGYTKTQQELLLRNYGDRPGFEFIVLRPGVIYGPGDIGISSRVGLKVGPLFFQLGRRCTLPLTYVDNCADAIVLAALRAPAATTWSIVDDELPSCGEYLEMYRHHVAKLRTVTLPYWLFALGARYLIAYHRRSQGQLPALFSPTLVRSMYRNFRYSNAALKQLGWRQQVHTRDALRITFDWCAAQQR